MAIIQYVTGANTITTTEWSCVSNTAGPTANTSTGSYWIILDTAAVAANDVFELKIYEKARSSGDTQRVMATYTFAGPQSDPLWTSPPVPLMNGWDMTLDKISGTDRAILWSIRKYS